MVASMSQSYLLTESGLQIRNSRNFETEEYVRFESINPLAQALRDYIVTGPGLIPGISAAGVCLQAQVHANNSTSASFYYTLQEAVLALKAARPYSFPLSRTVNAISRLVSDLINDDATPQDCCKALKCLHSIICNSIDSIESQMRPYLESTLPQNGVIAAVGGFGSQHSVSRGTLVPVLIDRKHKGKTVPRVFCPVASPLTETYYTVKELLAAGCPADLVTDAGLPHLMLRENAQALYVIGARICANGDVITPAGATAPAALAKQLGIPVHIVAYHYVFDANYATAQEAPFEEFSGQDPSLGAVPVSRRPLADIIPREWVTDYITSAGVISSGNSEALAPFMIAADTAHLAAMEAVKRLF